jgi:putative PIG3 family NAD(P)H quinone oxidoreductase
MKAVVITKPGGPEVLEVRDVEEPEPGPGEVLVDVRATAVNRADVLQRMGRYPPPPGTREDVPGLEMAGVVASVGKRVRGARKDDRVMALLPGAGYAERVVVPEELLLPAPGRLSFEEAAAVPEVFLTAFDALFLQCGLADGEVVLVHACGSGVGTAAIQLAAAAGCRVLGTSGSPEKLERAAELGLDVGLNRHDGDFSEAVRDETNGHGADVILDVVGAPYWEANVASLAPRGRIVLVGTLGGAKTEVNLSALMRKRATVKGTVLRSRPVAEKAALTEEFRRKVIPQLESGKVRPVVHAVYALEEAAEAHRQMEANANFGKLVLRIGG